MVGDLIADQVVPEGFEDLSCEGPEARHFQVKSRQERVGDFSVREVAAHIVKMIEAARERDDDDTDQLVLVLERPVKGCAISRRGVIVGDLPVDDHLRVAVHDELRDRGHELSVIGEVVGRVEVVVLPWGAAAEEIRQVVAGRQNLPAVAVEPVMLALRDAVAACVDANASAVLAERAGLDRTRIERLVTEVSRLIDLDALQQALTSGACEPVNFDEEISADSFYEGVDVQPGHIAASLPAPRPEVTGTVVDALERDQAVLVTGPSGVGKSTVMWAAAYSTRHVLWYRVRRLLESDVEPIARLVEATRPSTRSPVGLVVDAVGQTGMRGWDALRLRLAGKTGIVLLGSARSEDLLPLETLSRATVVPVRLDEEVAEEIHAGLLERSMTELRHWRHAYDQAHGLTLEFTHLLTRGKRLADVISEQVRARIRDGRETELSILALVSTAHRWGATLNFRRVQDALGVGDIVLREALDRLTDEHLIRSTGTNLSGLHQLRSGALSQSVHAQPPPALNETVATILPMLDTADLLPFVVGVLNANEFDDVSVLDTIVVDHVVGRLANTTSGDAWTTALHALHLVDFHREAAVWADICSQLHVPPGLHQIVAVHVLGGIEPLENTRPEVAGAIREINAIKRGNSPLRDKVLTLLGPERIGGALAVCTQRDHAAFLLATIAEAGIDLSAQSASLRDADEAPLIVAMRSMDVDDLSVILRGAHDVSADLYDLLFDAVGGTEAMRNKLFAHSPWLIDVTIQDQQGKTVACARILHIADHMVGDTEKTALDLGKLMARCFPRCHAVDVRTVVPGGAEWTADGAIGSRRFSAKHEIAPVRGTWNRLRSQIATAAAGTTDPTLRVQRAHDLLVGLKRYLELVTTMWLVGPVSEAEKEETRQLLTDLHDRAEQLTLPTNRTDLIVGPGETTAHRSDNLGFLISFITGNLTSRLTDLTARGRSLAFFVADTLRRNLANVRSEEQWHLIDTDPPAVIDDLDSLLMDLHAVLAERTKDPAGHAAILASLRDGKRRELPIRIAANLAREKARRRMEAMHKSYRRTLRDNGVRAAFLTETFDDESAYDWPPMSTAITIDIRSFADWANAHEVVQRKLQEEIDQRFLGTHSLLVPFLRGRPVEPLAQRISDRLTPDYDNTLKTKWRALLGDRHPTPMADAFNEAIDALVAISALGTLRSSRPEGHASDERFAGEVAKLQSAIAAATALDAEDVVIRELVTYLSEIARRVEREINDDTITLSSATFAADLYAGQHGEPSDLMKEVMVVSVLAVQWDISPTEAVSAYELLTSGST